MTLTVEQVDVRRQGIGGTDMAALLGLSPYMTPLQLWLDKTGRAKHADDPEATERMYWGSALEDVVARRYAEITDRRIQRINDPLIHAGGIVRGNIDRAVVNPSIRGNVRFIGGRLTTDRILEVKTAHAMAAYTAEWGEGKEDVPQHYWIQTQVYLGLSQCELCDLAVLFGGQKLRVYSIAADRQIFEDLVAEATAWWNRHVIADMPPEPRTEDEARRLWKSHVAGKSKIVDVGIAQSIDDLVAVKAQIKTLEESEQQLRDHILPAFGDAEEISYMGRRLGTWKQNRASRKTNWKELAEWAMREFDDNARASAIESHTDTIEGARVLRLTSTKEA